MTNASAFLFIVFMAVSTATGILLLARVWKVRREPGAYSLMGSILCLVIWTFTYALEIASTDIGVKTFWLKAEYIGIPFISLAIFSFGLTHSEGGKWLSWNRLALLAIVPGLTFILALTNEHHNLLWTQITPPPASVGPLAVEHGLWFVIYAVYSYALLLFTAFFFVRVAVRKRGIYRSQALIMLVGMLAPWIGNVIYLFQLSPLKAYDWTPLAFTLTVLALEIGFTRYRLVDIAPFAQATIFNAMLDAVLVVNNQDNIVEANPAAERVFGMDEAFLIGRHVVELFPEWSNWTHVTRPRSETSREYRLPDDPEQRVFNLRLENITNRRGQTTGYLTILTNITRNVNAQSMMRLLVAALEAAQNGVLITDQQGMVQWVNPAFTQLTGFERNEIIGHTPGLLNSGRQPPEFYADLWGKILNGQVWHGELINRRKDGSEYYEEMTITPLVQASGAITNFIAIKQDISQRKAAEQALQAAHQEAVEASRLKTQLLANVSHDLRSPLGTIMGYAEMMQMNVFGETTKEQKKVVSEILDSANTLLTFVNNLIGQAQIETGKVMLNDQPYEPATLIESIRSSINYHVTKKGLTLQVEIDPRLPATLLGDSYWLRQVLLNLVNNAVKFTETGGVTVRMCKENDGFWAIQVEDTGVGIPQEAHQSIFEVFRQQDVTVKRKYGGSGLGLSIVKELTGLMGGRIELHSEPGQGSIFTVFLPLQVPPEETA